MSLDIIIILFVIVVAHSEHIYLVQMDQDHAANLTKRIFNEGEIRPHCQSCIFIWSQGFRNMPQI